MLEFPVAKVAWALFRGIEQEGPNKGLKTLFVVGDVPIFEIQSKFCDIRAEVIYFGAGGRFDYNTTTVEYLTTHPDAPQFKLTIECPKFDYVLMKKLCFHNKNTIWVVPYVWGGYKLNGFDPLAQFTLSNYANADKIYLKVDTGERVILSKLSDCVINKYSEGYAGDKLLLQKER